MRFAGSGRFVFIAQWVLAVLLPNFFFIGRGWVGAEVGWLGLVGLGIAYLAAFVLAVAGIVRGRRVAS